MSVLLLLLNITATVIIVLHGLFNVINSMGRKTALGMRAAWLVITTCALAILLGPLFDKPTPGPYWSGILAGIALYILFDRRRSEAPRTLP